MIVVVGSINLDLVARVDRLPLPGETVQAESFVSFHGGKGANQAVAAARLGGDVFLVGAVGDDETFGTLLDGLDAEGVDISAVQTIDGVSTGTALITVDRGGENTIAVHGGANRMVQLTTASRLLIETADVLLMQLEVPVDVVVEAAQIATGTVMLNAAPAMQLSTELIERLDVLIVNEHERSIAISPGEEEAIPIVVTTLGARGATVSTRSGDFDVAAHRVDVVDTTGAGDTFCGAFAEAHDRGEDTMDAVEWATHAGSLATTGMGARAAMPTRDDMEP